MTQPSPEEIVLDAIRKEIKRRKVVIPMEVATRVAMTLREENPKALVAWLNRNAERLILDAVLKLNQSKRTTAGLEGSSQQRMARAVDHHRQTGSTERLEAFLEVRYRIGADRKTKSIRHMTAADCTFVAERFESKANLARMRAAFFRAVAKKVGDKTIGEVFDEDTISNLWRELTGEKPPLRDAA